METNESPERELAIAERAAAAPWIDTPPPSKWWAPAGAVLIGLLVFLLGERDTLNSVLWVVLVGVVVMLEGAWLGWGQARMQVVPRLRNAPAEFVPVIRGYLVAFLLLLGVVVALFLSVDSRVAAAVAAVGYYLIQVLSIRSSEMAAEAVRDRLA